MREVFAVIPPGAVPSPDQSIEIPLREITRRTKYPHAIFAVILASAIGYFDPLLARLRDPRVKLEWYERKFLADNWGKRRLGGDRQVKTDRKYLGITAHYLEFTRGELEPDDRGKKAAAVGHVCEKYDIDPREFTRAKNRAKEVRYGSGLWLDLAVRLATKGKFEQLHRTY